MSLPLAGKVSLVTGASRGIGAAVAFKLAIFGSDLILNFRNKSARAEEVAREIKNQGRTAIPLQADITVDSELEAMMAAIQQRFHKLDILILNASGGLERGKTEDYAMTLNRTAQLRTAILATKLMSGGGRIVFVTSHWAHFYTCKPVIPEYETVAKSKFAGEKALREIAPSWASSGISLVIVSGDAIEGTITPRLLERKNPGLLQRRLTPKGNREPRPLPTIDQFADEIAKAAVNPALPTGHTIFVGSTDY